MTSHLWVLGFGRPSWVTGLEIYGIFGSAAWYPLQFFCNMIPVEQKRKNGNRDQHNRDALSIFVARSITAILVLYNHLFEKRAQASEQNYKCGESQKIPVQIIMSHFERIECQ